MGGVEAVIMVLLVIDADDVDGVSDAERGFEAVVHGGGYRPRRIERFDHRAHAADHFIALLGRLHGFFVEDRPQIDGRMVAVAANQPCQLLEIVRRGVEIAVLGHDQKAVTVAGVHQDLVLGIVREADGVAACFFQAAQTKFDKAVGHGRADAGMVLMQADPFDFHRFVVEEKAEIGVETRRAEAARRLHLVETNAVLLDPCLHIIEVRIVGRPQCRTIAGEVQARRDGAKRRDTDGGLRLSDNAGHDTAYLIVPKFGGNGHGYRSLAGIVERHFNGDFPIGAAIRYRIGPRMGKNAVGDDMDRVALDYPGVAIDARTFVPPAFHGGGVDANDQDILVVVGDIGRQVDIGRRIAAPVPFDQCAVEPDSGKGGDAVELQFDMFAVVGGVECQVIAIPGDTAAAIALVDIGGFFNGLETGEVVREGDLCPGTVVIAGAGGTQGMAGLGGIIGVVMADQYRHRNIAVVEAPALVQQQGFAR